MLGVKTRRMPIKGKIAKDIRSAVVRINSGKLNETDQRSVRNSKEALKYFHAIWD